MDELALESQNKDGSRNDQQVELWKDMKKAEDTSLILQSKKEIEEYVLSIVKNYFRSTKKATVGLESPFKTHGLDSLDVIELCIQIEDELGYLIDSENLEKFTKPKHFSNFIWQYEQFRKANNKLPHEGIAADVSLRSIFPGIPGGKK